MKKVDPLLYALYNSSYASLRLAHLLPKTDICEDLKQILMEQCTILCGILEGDRFLMKDIENFIEECQTIAQQAEGLDAIQE